jgi:hypothetical protein
MPARGVELSPTDVASQYSGHAPKSSASPSSRVKVDAVKVVLNQL